MPNYTITFTGPQQAIAAQALHDRNTYLQNANLPTLTMEQYLQEQVESILQCSTTHIEARERGSLMGQLMSSVDSVPTGQLQALIAAANGLRPGG